MTKGPESDARGCMLTPQITALQIKNFRNQLGLTQEAFAREFNIPVGTLRDWEQGTRNSRASQLFVAAMAGQISKPAAAAAAEAKANNKREASPSPV